jgi:hypothetical protein
VSWIVGHTLELAVLTVLAVTSLELSGWAGILCALVFALVAAVWLRQEWRIVRRRQRLTRRV